MKNLKRRGFAMATAIFLIPLASVAMMSIGMLAVADYHRTASVAQGAQLRQLLIAASIDVRSHVPDAGSAENWEMVLPAGMSANGAKVETTMNRDGQSANLTITATIGVDRASEQMKFVRDADHWRVLSTELVDTSD